MDETGFNLWTKRTYGRSRVGERCNRIVGGQRGRNTTVITAISDQVGVFYHEVHFRTVTKETFNGFMNSLSMFLEDQVLTVIMDNAPVHNGVQEIYPDIQVKYLPPYSPFLNPIENCFSVFKSYVKQFVNEESSNCTTERARAMGTTQVALRERALRGAIQFAMPRVTKEIVADNYRNSNSYLGRCFDREDILD